MTRFGTLVVLLFILIAPVLSPAETRSKIKGTVVAESSWNGLHACWHVCGLTLLVRLDREGTYVIVNMTYMDDHSKPMNGAPLELTRRSQRWQFKVEKGGEASPLLQDMSITESDVDVKERVKVPAWRVLAGAENEALPFGKWIPSYSVAVGKFKSLR